MEPIADVDFIQGDFREPVVADQLVQLLGGQKLDLVIHNNQDVKSPVGIIFETKKPTRTINAEMPRLDNLNTKAFQQLVLYFLRERVTDKNLEIKHLIVTNILSHLHLRYHLHLI